jgi:hypothetical protein
MARYSAFRGGFALLVLTTGLAVPRAAHAGPDNGTLSIEAENDYFSPDNRDRHYTNGLRIDWLPAPSAPGDEDWFERTAEDIPLIGADEPGTGRIGWTLGQSLYTPQNKTATQPILNDRPYAGWLYAGLSLIKAPTPDPKAPTSVTGLDTLEIDLGVVGRAALGQAVQNGFHRIFFANEQVNGWHNQLKSEPGLLISYDHKWRALAQTNIWGLGADVTPDVGFDLGNVQIDGSVGGMIRIGRDLPSDYGPPRIRPGLSGSNFFLSDEDSQRDFGWYLFAGAEGRGVVHDIFLDGNSFATSQSVPKKTWVADFQAGAAIIVYGIRLTATEVIRTEEFHGQHGPDEFGSISASFNF